MKLMFKNMVHVDEDLNICDVLALLSNIVSKFLEKESIN